MEMLKPRVRYEILSGGDWILAKKAEVLPSGWLHYELPDGTIGLLSPLKGPQNSIFKQKWREQPVKRKLVQNNFPPRSKQDSKDSFDEGTAF